MTRIAVLGPRDFTLKGKYPHAPSAAAELVLGFMQGLPKYATIVCGGQFEYPDGVDSWVIQAFKILKDKKQFHFVELSPQHLQGKAYHELDWVTRRKALLDACDKLYVFIPTEYNGGETAEILQLARMRHLPHTIFRVDPRGDVSSILEVKSKDTFVPVEVKASNKKHDIPGSTVHRKPIRPKAKLSKATTPKRGSTTTLKRRPRKKVPVSTSKPTRLKRVARPNIRKSTAKGGKRETTKPSKGQLILKRRIGK